MVVKGVSIQQQPKLLKRPTAPAIPLWITKAVMVVKGYFYALFDGKQVVLSKIDDAFCVRLNVGQSDVIFCKAARCGFGAADVSQLSPLKPAPESVAVGITVQH